MSISDRLVFESPADQEGFTMMPNTVLLDAALSMPARLLYGCLLHHARQGNACFPGQARLAAYLGVTDRSVRGYLTELVEAMLVRIEREDRRRTNRYVILALHLRSERLAEVDRKPASGHVERKPASGPTGSLLPVEEEEGKKTQSSVARAPARARAKGRRPDPDQLPMDLPSELTGPVEKTVQILQEVANEHGGRAVSARAVAAAIMAEPDVDHVGEAHRMRSWAATRDVRDATATYRNWLTKAPRMAKGGTGRGGGRASHRDEAPNAGFIREMLQIGGDLPREGEGR